MTADPRFVGRVRRLAGPAGPPPAGGSFVLYWMQSSVRAENNAALDFAISQANSLGLPLLAAFGITDTFPGANERSFAFLFEGLLDAAITLRRRGVRLVVIRRPPPDVIRTFASQAALVVVDGGYLRILRLWRQQVGKDLAAMGKQLFEVEDNTLIPTALIRSPPGGEKAAATLRPKLMAEFDRFARVFPPLELSEPSFAAELAAPNLAWLQLLYSTSAPTSSSGSSDYIQNCLLHATFELSSGNAAAWPDYYPSTPASVSASSSSASVSTSSAEVTSTASGSIDTSTLLLREQHYYRLLGRAAADNKLKQALFERMLAGMTNLDRTVPRIQGNFGRHGGLTEARKRLLEWVGGHKALLQVVSTTAGIGAGVVASFAAASSSSSSSSSAAPPPLVSPQLAAYSWNRKKPEVEGRTSQLSPYLHYGHISPAEIVVAVLKGYEDALCLFPATTAGAGATSVAMSSSAAAGAGPSTGAGGPPSSSSAANKTADLPASEPEGPKESAEQDESKERKEAEAEVMPEGMDFGGVEDNEDDDGDEEDGIAAATDAKRQEEKDEAHKDEEGEAATSSSSASSATAPTSEISAPALPSSASAPANPSLSASFASAVRAATAAARLKVNKEDRDRFINEVIVWRESAIHFCLAHSSNYDDFSVIEQTANWAVKSMMQRIGDRPRPPLPLPVLAASSSSASSASLPASSSLPPYLTKWLPHLLVDHPASSSSSSSSASASSSSSSDTSSSPSTGLFTLRQLETGNTSDPHWNAAQLEMVLTGRMHGYLRMYWAKTLNLWCYSPQLAHALAVYLNDKWQLDGRDPNGYLGVAWCFGVFDRPMGDRPVVGSVRPMTAAGLASKINTKAYLARIARLAADCSCPRTRAWLSPSSALAMPSSSASSSSSSYGRGSGGVAAGGTGLAQRGILSYFQAAPAGSSAFSSSSSSSISGVKRKAPEPDEEAEMNEKKEEGGPDEQGSNKRAVTATTANAFAEMMRAATGGGGGSGGAKATKKTATTKKR